MTGEPEQNTKLIIRNTYRTCWTSLFPEAVLDEIIAIAIRAATVINFPAEPQRETLVVVCLQSEELRLLCSHLIQY